MQIRLATIFQLIFLLIFQLKIAIAQTQFTPHGIGGGGYTYSPSISPHDPADLFLNCDMAGTYRSRDGGATWRMLPYLQLVSRNKAKIQFTADPQILFTTSRSRTNSDDPRWRGELVRSTDGGATFQKITDPTSTGIHRLEADPNSTQRLILSEYDRLFFSGDGGATWRLIFTPPSGDMWLGGVFWDGATILVGTNHGLLVSKNSGATFALETHAGLPAGSGIYHLAGAKSGGTTRLFCIPAPADEMQAWLDVLDFRGKVRGIFRMNYTPTAAWTNTRANIPPDLEIGWTDLAKNNIQTVWLAAEVNSVPYIFKSTDGGASWVNMFQTVENQNIATGWGGEYGAVSWQWSGAVLGFDVSDKDPNHVILSDGLGHLTTDGGATWRATYVSENSRNAAGQPAAIPKFYQSSGLDVTSVNHIFWKNDFEMFLSNCDIGHTFSNDGGQNWTLARNTFQWSTLSDNNWYRVAQQPSNGYLFAATSDQNDIFESHFADYPLDFAGGVVLKSTDGGATWDTVFNFKHPVVWLEIDRNDPSKIYASVVHSVQGGIFRSTNGGASWTKLPPPPRTAGHPNNLVSLADGSLVATFAARYFTYLDADGNERDSLTQSSGVFILPPGSTVWQDRTAPAMRYFTKDLTIDPHDAAQNTWYATVWGGYSTFFDASNPNNDNGGLYRSTNRGLSWTRIFADEQAQNLGIHPTRAGKAWLCLENNGLFSTENLTATQPTFERVEEFPYWRPKRVFFKPNHPCEVWIGTQGGGLWRGTSGGDVAPTAAFSATTTDLTASFSNASANATSFSWDFGDGSPISTEANPTHQFASAGNFTVVLTATNDCGSATFSQQVTVACPAVFVEIVAAGATSICPGAAVELQATAGFVVYNWSINGVPQPPSNNANFTANDPATYFVKATDAAGCSGSSNALSVTQKPLPTAAFSFSKDDLTASFSNASANATSFAWDFGDGSPTSTEANPTHQFASAGNFTVVLTATNDCGTATFSQQVAVACPAVFVEIVAAGATSICPGASVELAATAGFQNYAWQHDGQPISGATGATFLASSAGNFSVVAMDGAGCTGSSQVVEIFEKPLPVANFSSSEIYLTATFSSLSDKSTTYAWNFGDPDSGTANTSTEANPAHFFSAAGTFLITLTATNDCGSATTTQAVTVVCPPISVGIEPLGATTFCLGGSVDLAATPGFQKYIWQRDGNLITGAGGVIFSATEAGDYSVVVTDERGCTGGNSQPIKVSIKPKPNVSFSVSVQHFTATFWVYKDIATSFELSFGDGAKTSSDLNPKHEYSTAPTTYLAWLFAENECGTDIYYKEVMTKCPKISVNLGATTDTVICSGDSVRLVATGSFKSYSLYRDSALVKFGEDSTFWVKQSGKYHVGVLEWHGCRGFSPTVEVLVNPLPQVALTGLAANFTDQDPPVALLGVPTGGTFSGAGVSAGQFDPKAAGVGTHEISYFFTDANGCSAAAVATTVVSPFVSTRLPDGVVAVEVFPNPTRGSFFLKIKILEDKSLKINLLNAVGQVVSNRQAEVQAGESNLLFENQDLPAGAYFLKILDDDGRQFFARVVIAD